MRPERKDGYGSGEVEGAFILLHLYFKDGRVDAAVLTFSSSSIVGDEHHVLRLCLLSLIRWFASLDSALIQSVFDELFNSVVEPDAVTFTVLVRGYGAEDPPRWGTIANLLTSMTRNHGISLTSGAQKKNPLQSLRVIESACQPLKDLGS